ncbi:hypothetical protein [Nocardia aurantiaca]|uniref:Uncharacterized protein n=1 Tax=Nocardia aurantiaca TaxID=2675850 RepID=A0A6I3L5P0_9NOCA|nr:hypothetical protein [Nocardia aurantiaca]MTE15974.1 hypothetical protein [Nocardia aurantiaca]
MALEMKPQHRPWVIRSDKTPEMAIRTTPSDDSWRLTWAPDRLFSLEAACHAMLLDEILSDPDPEDLDQALEVAELLAGELGFTLREVLVRLWNRSDRQERRTDSAAPPHRAAPVHG